MIMIPKVKQTYNYFDDGKIRESRRENVTVIEVIPFNEIDIEIKSVWENQVKIHTHLYSEETDCFVKCVSKENMQELIFVRTKDGGWFSFNNFLWDGRLDIDGKLTESLK